MENKISSLTKTQMRMNLNRIGLEEKYRAFNYLSDIIFFMIENDDSQDSFRQAISLTCDTYSIEERSLKSSIQDLLKSCDEKVTKRAQFNLKYNSIYNKIIVIKNYILNRMD